MRADIAADVDAERRRQGALWNRAHEWGTGDCSSREVADVVKVAVLTEEVGEVARAVLVGDVANLRDELVQVAAVAVAWLESFETGPEEMCGKVLTP